MKHMGLLTSSLPYHFCFPKKKKVQVIQNPTHEFSPLPSILGSRILILLRGFGHQHFLSHPSGWISSHVAYVAYGPLASNLKIAWSTSFREQKKHNRNTTKTQQKEVHQFISTTPDPFNYFLLFVWFHGSKNSFEKIFLPKKPQPAMAMCLTPPPTLGFPGRTVGHLQNHRVACLPREVRKPRGGGGREEAADGGKGGTLLSSSCWWWAAWKGWEFV